ncbi:uncharacterized protein LOC144452069 [Glandiceps talaboti]
MPNYKLHYFDTTGRAEVTRLMFAAAGVEFEDIRHTFSEWPEFKKSDKVILGSLPILEVDGKTVIAQSYAIARYVANELGFAGKTNLEKARVDMIADAVLDLLNGAVKFMFEEDKTLQEEYKKVHVTKTVPEKFAALEKLLVANNGGNGFFVGDSLTWADLAFLAHTNIHIAKIPEVDFLAPNKKLAALRDRLSALPRIKKWIEADSRYFLKIELNFNRYIMPKYVLTYFNVRARAEVSRLIFAAAGVDFEDVRVSREKWGDMKNSGKFPFAALPILEVDGTTIAQSYAIARFLANEFGLAGKNDLEKAKVDMIADAFLDLFNQMAKLWFEKDEDKKKELREAYVTKSVPNTLAALVKLLEANNGGNGFFVGDSLTWADLAFLVQCDYYLDQLKEEDVLAPHKKLVALRERLVALPKLKTYLDTRPQTHLLNFEAQLTLYTMPQYKLTYFNAKARAEVTRLIFAAAGVEFEDVRVEFADWPPLKASGKFPFGSLPLLEVDGCCIAESYAIARFVANECGLAGKTNVDKARVDMIADAVKDLADSMYKLMFEKDEAKKKELTDTFLTKTVPTTLSALEKILEANNGGNGFFVGDKLTWADLAFLAHTDFYCAQFKDANLLAPHKKLTALRSRVSELPNIKKWIATRPESSF